VRVVGLLLWPGAVALGVSAEAAAFRSDEPERWLPDLAVGLTFIACGLLAWRHSRGPAALLAATGASSTSRCWSTPCGESATARR
jgi:hypothetical protein